MLMRKDITSIIARFKDLSLNISERKISAMSNFTDKIMRDQYIAALDDEQRDRVSRLFYEINIHSQDEAYKFFYDNNKVFFYGNDPTNLGYMNQMFLYDIDKIDKSSVNLLGVSKDFDFITVGVKHFHGILDIIGDEKIGSQNIDSQKVVFYDDAEEMYTDVIDKLNSFGEITPKKDSLTYLLMKQWPNLHPVEQSTMSDYISWLKIHEGAHLLFNDVLDIQNCRFNHPLQDEIYGFETEKLAILSQIAFSHLPEYTFMTFMTSSKYNYDYDRSISNILSDFSSILSANSLQFPEIDPSLFNKNNYCLEDSYLMINSLAADKIQSIAKFILEKQYKPIFCRDKEKTRWAFDAYDERIAIFDSNDELINRVMDFSKEKYINTL